MIQALSFDCYGTLVDWETGIKKFFLEHGISATIDEWERAQFSLLRPPFDTYRNIMKKSISSFCDNPETINLFPESVLHWPLFDDLPALLAVNKKIILVSNMDNDLLSKTVERFPFKVDLLISAEDVKSYKPSTKHFETMLDTSGLAPSELLHCAFGMEYDLKPASKLGIQTLLVNRKKLSWPRKINSLYELPEYLS